MAFSDLATRAVSEDEFAAVVDALAADPVEEVGKSGRERDQSQ